MINVLPLCIYAVFFLAAVFAPLRWSIVAFLLLSTIDLGSLNASVGLLNTAKAIVLPVYLLWRLRGYAGHHTITFGSITWGLLILYVAVASMWSLFPAYAIKLIGHMIGSLVICLMLARATKGGYLRQTVVLPVAIGAIGIAALHWIFDHNWGGETDRFTTFSSAQAFAAFITAFYCMALCTKSLKLAIRLPLCAALGITVLLDGSRLWIAGLLISTLFAIFVSAFKPWIKLLTFGAMLTLVSVLVGESETIMNVIERNATSNRIAAAITAAYEGDLRSSGLGTYNLRHAIYRRSVEGIESGSLLEILFGHGTCNGALIVAPLSKNPDPNRAMHNEWLRAAYEWGITGLILWLLFIGSLVVYAIEGTPRDRMGNAKPLLIYVPAFLLGLSGENIIAGAGNAVSVGLLTLVALASIAHRRRPKLAYIRSRPFVPEHFLYVQRKVPWQKGSCGFRA